MKAWPWTLLPFFLILSPATIAQNVRVTKVSGKKAIVVRESGPPLKVGMLLTGGGDEFSEDEFGTSRATGQSSGPGGPRDNTVGGSAGFAFTNTDSNGTKTSGNVINLSAYYGWNKKSIEYGPRFNFRRNSSESGTSSSSSTQFGLGGFFDYNFSPNVPGTTLIYAVGASLDYLNGSSSSGGDSTSTIEFFAGPAIKWFPLGNSVAVRGDGGINYSSSSAGSVTSTATTFLVRAGLQVYF